jgi:hypothetical protein
MTTSLSFSTLKLHQKSQFDAWRSFYEPIFDVVPHQAVDSGFAAELHLWALDRFAMSITLAPRALITRAKTHLRQDPVDHWVISYCARRDYRRRFGRCASEGTEPVVARPRTLCMNARIRSGSSCAGTPRICRHCTGALCSTRLGSEHASGTFARRLHDRSRTPSAEFDRG